MWEMFKRDLRCFWLLYAEFWPKHYWAWWRETCAAHNFDQTCKSQGSKSSAALDSLDASWPASGFGPLWPSLEAWSNTLPETNSLPLKIGHPRRKFHLPTKHFQVQFVSFREGMRPSKFLYNGNGVFTRRNEQSEKDQVLDICDTETLKEWEWTRPHLSAYLSLHIYNIIIIRILHVDSCVSVQISSNVYIHNI